jgi:hypothetical protein
VARVKRSRWQREKDLAEITNLYLLGKTQRDIAGIICEDRDYSLSQQQISADLSEVQRRWRESSVRDFDELKGRELARIDLLERTYWAAWEESRKRRERRKTGRVSGAAQRDTAEIVTEDQIGDHRFLQGIQWCIERRCAILGLDSPTKIAPTDPAGRKPYRITEKERETRVRELLEKAMGKMIPKSEPEE